MKVQCCICQVVLRDDGNNDEKISYAYCPKHFEEAMKEIRKIKKDKIK